MLGRFIHLLINASTKRMKQIGLLCSFSALCPEADSNRYGCPPPPQDGASTNFATRAFTEQMYKLLLKIVRFKPLVAGFLNIICAEVLTISKLFVLLHPQ